MIETTTFHRRTFQPGDVIFDVGDFAGAIYTIVSGAVEIRAKSLGGDFHPVALMGRGEVFGEVALIEGRLHQGTAVAMGKTVVVEIKRREFFSRLISLDPLMKKVVVHLATSLHETTDKLKKYEET